MKITNWFKKKFNKKTKTFIKSFWEYRGENDHAQYILAELERLELVLKEKGLYNKSAK
jgi:hypothetical protein